MVLVVDPYGGLAWRDIVDLQQQALRRVMRESERIAVWPNFSPMAQNSSHKASSLMLHSAAFVGADVATTHAFAFRGQRLVTACSGQHDLLLKISSL